MSTHARKLVFKLFKLLRYREPENPLPIPAEEVEVKDGFPFAADPPPKFNVGNVPPVSG